MLSRLQVYGKISEEVFKTAFKRGVQVNQKDENKDFEKNKDSQDIHRINEHTDLQIYEEASKNTVKPRSRGTDPEDEKSFSVEAVKILRIAQEEVAWLLDRGYPVNAVITLVGGHYQLTARQRLAVQRATSSTTQCLERRKRLLSLQSELKGPLQIDGFNLIITLEVALSGGILLSCNDGTIRDLAGLRGTYHPIDKTDQALLLLGKAFKELSVPEVTFWLDSPVSNSGRLKSKILEYGEQWGIPVRVELVPNADPILSRMERVITSDSIILDTCGSWLNLADMVIRQYIREAVVIDLSR
ncbi:MAG: DUF434 domain-containing protein [Clostridia bacterium]|nr:DUF434 domain-containing protein [Clostridia bacterium]